jgi:HSP20 family protein
MTLQGLKQGATSLWDTVADSVAEGWQRVRQQATGALTRFKPDEHRLPARGQVDDEWFLPSHGWSMLGGDVFEDDKRLVVRVEVPGMEKDDLDVHVADGNLVVRGEKRFEHESTEGRWRVLQCAYGSFNRVVPLPAAVRADEARARYHNGVLKIELPKAEPGRPKALSIKVA